MRRALIAWTAGSTILPMLSPAQAQQSTEALAAAAQNPVAAARVFKIGGQPINMSLQFDDYAAHPTFGPRWTVRFSVQLLFPR